MMNKKLENIINLRYLSDGSMVERIQILSNGKFLVSELILTKYGELSEGKLLIVDEVFTRPPEKLYNKEIEDLKNKKSDLLNEYNELYNKLQDLYVTENEMLGKFKKVKALKKIEDFIDGKITHYVTDFYSIRSIDKTMDKDPFDGRLQLQLLTLFGKTNGDLEWKLNSYADGSGSYSTIYPATSYPEALSILKELIEERIRKTKSCPEEHVYSAAKEYGFTVPIEYERKILENEENRKQSRIEDLKKKLSELESD